jgi:hypothetical protein
VIPARQVRWFFFGFFVFVLFTDFLADTPLFPLKKEDSFCANESPTSYWLKTSPELTAGR